MKMFAFNLLFEGNHGPISIKHVNVLTLQQKLLLFIYGFLKFSQRVSLGPAENSNDSIHFFCNCELVTLRLN